MINLRSFERREFPADQQQTAADIDLGLRCDDVVADAKRKRAAERRVRQLILHAAQRQPFGVCAEVEDREQAPVDGLPDGQMFVFDDGIDKVVVIEIAARAVPPETPPARLIGEAMHTYILVEKGDTLILIDKHAAHERINFDRLRQNPADIPSQTLLEPLPFTPDASDAEVLQQHGDTLAELGFTLEPFGRSDYILRGVPAQIDAGDALPALEEICAQLRHGAHTDAQSVRDEVLKTVACKAAIKAGWQTEPEELLRLADAVCAGEVKYCPHGRPVAVTLTRRELDKLFKRIV